MKKLPVALALLIAFVIAGCSSGSSGGTPAKTAAPRATDAASKTAATTIIKKNWATFFNSSTPHATAASFLENGATLGPAIKEATKIANKEKTKESAVVSKVVFTNPTNANVTYTLFGNGKPLLKHSTGKSVLQGGTWKVAQNTFCSLVDLGAQATGLKNPPPGC